MQSIQIENPRGFDPELDVEPDKEPCMVDSSDSAECTVKVFAITLNLSKSKAIALARMLYKTADKI